MESFQILLQQWEEGVASTALKIRIPVTMLKFAIGLLASYPFAAILKSIPHSYHKLKHALSMCTGLLMLRYVYGADWMHGVVSSSITYLICLLAPRKHVHVYVFIWAMGYMTLSHLYRMTFFYMVDQFDFTRTQMVLTMKLTSFAYNLYDGSCNDNINNTTLDAANATLNGSANGSANGGNNDLSSAKTASAGGSSYAKRIAAERAKYAIINLPSPLEFGGFVFCFPNLLAGPAFVYQDYMRGIDWKELGKEPDAKECDGQSDEKSLLGSDGKQLIKSLGKGDDIGTGTWRESGSDVEYEQPNSVLPALHRLFLGLCSLIIFFVISSKAPISRQYDPAWQTSHSFLYRMVFISVSFLGERFKFYFAWKVSEGACIMGGFGFEGRGDKNGGEAGSDKSVSELKGVKDEKNLDGKNRAKSLTLFETFQKHIVTGWRGVENIDILAFETGNSIQSLSRAWNKRTQNWLERYVYQRTERSLVATYAVSALWHGLYPGFFMFFFAAALMSATERLVRVKLNPLILTDPSSPYYQSMTAKSVRIVYSVLCWLVTSATLTYHAQTFYMRSFERSIGAFKSFYFIPNIAFLAVYFLLELAPTPRKACNAEIKNKNL